MSWLDGFSPNGSARSCFPPAESNGEQADEVRLPSIARSDCRRTAAGADAEDCAAASTTRFGNPTAVRQELRELGWRSRVDGRYVNPRPPVRVPKAPAFADLCLDRRHNALHRRRWRSRRSGPGLGIALRPLQYPAGDRPRQVQAHRKPFGEAGRGGVVGRPLSRVFRLRGPRSRRSRRTSRTMGRDVTDREEPVSPLGRIVSPSLFGMLGARPLDRPTFRPADERTGYRARGDHQSFTSGPRAMGADSAIVGRSLELNRRPSSRSGE